MLAKTYCNKVNTLLLLYTEKLGCVLCVCHENPKKSRWKSSKVKKLKNQKNDVLIMNECSKKLQIEISPINMFSIKINIFVSF